MHFAKLLEIVGQDPVFETGHLLVGNVNPAYLRRQLSDWVAEGKVWQLRRGLYAPAPPYQKTSPHPFLVANRMVIGSYVSLEAALSYYGLIPEHVPVVTSVTTRRPGTWTNPLGQFTYRHVQPGLFWGYQVITMDRQQWAYVALPEKALLDLIYLRSGADSPDFLRALRLQNVDLLDVTRLTRLGNRMNKPKLQRAVRQLTALLASEQEAYEPL